MRNPLDQLTQIYIQFDMDLNSPSKLTKLLD